MEARTGTELGTDIYELAPAWSRRRQRLDEPVVVTRMFLLALNEMVEREQLNFPGGSFGSAEQR